MMLKHTAVVTVVVVLALGSAAASNPLAVLQSDASLEEKAEACRLISISGDTDALPVLESLLADEQLSHMARYALEPMPGPEADAALRRALHITTGTLKAGVIASLGVRRDAAAVPELIALLADDNGFVVEAAARALGRIAEPEGVNALSKAIADPDRDYAATQAVADGLFAAAENALANDERADAIRLYDDVYAIEALPGVIRAAALRGAILARHANDGLPLLMDALTGDDATFFEAALRAALELENRDAVARIITDVLPSLSADRKIQVVRLLGELGQDAAGPALLREAETGPTAVRVAALQAAVRLAYAPVIPVLAQLVLAEEANLATIARDGLSHFPGSEGDIAVKNMLKNDDAQMRRIAVELIGKGALPDPANLLMQVANDDTDEAVRLAALRSVKEYVGVPQMQGLLGHLLEARSEDEMLAAEQGLVLLAMQQQDNADSMPAEIITALCDALNNSDDEVQRAVVRILAATGSQKAFDAVLPLTMTNDDNLQDTAMRAVCDWPTPLALSTVIAWVKTTDSNTLRARALRSAVRLLALEKDTPEALSQHYATLLEQAASTDEKNLILSGLARIGHAAALDAALEQLDDESVRAEAILAAIAIAKQLGDSPQDAEALERAKSLIPELRQGIEE